MRTEPNTTAKKLRVIGAGLAGCECALTLAEHGFEVELIEQRPLASSPIHRGADLAELVCSNSFKSTKENSAAGLLKWELQTLGSHLISIAYESRVAAGGALAVDRKLFSQKVEKALEACPNISIKRRQENEVPQDWAVIATGPLCSEGLFSQLQEKLGEKACYFFDAAAPIVDAESLDSSLIFSQSRYGDAEEPGDYLNCPLDKETYEHFWQELVNARRVLDHSFSQKELFQACQPLEEVARTGKDSLRFGAFKPIGLIDPRTKKRPWAVVQLRAENKEKTAYNLVGFQTNLAWPEQKRVFRLIPGLSQAEFFRYGVMHRNSYVNSPKVLSRNFRIPGTKTYLAGQITGTEGYTEAIASGRFVALALISELRGKGEIELPKTGALGSLLAYASDPATQNYQPMHVNFGLLPPLDQKLKKQERYAAYVSRAKADLLAWKSSHSYLFDKNASAADSSQALPPSNEAKVQAEPLDGEVSAHAV